MDEEGGEHRFRFVLISAIYTRERSGRRRRRKSLDTHPLYTQFGLAQYLQNEN